MRIYEGSPRQDFEEVFRSIGAHLDQLGMREILLVEIEDGFFVQGLVIEGVGAWSDGMASVRKMSVTFRDDDISSFMDEGLARRGSDDGSVRDVYESALRVIGRYLDDTRPRDVFFFEQDGAFVLRLLRVLQTGTHHELVEFTRDDVVQMIAGGPTLRAPRPTAGKPG